jgi:hypothetical protein
VGLHAFKATSMFGSVRCRNPPLSSNIHIKMGNAKMYTYQVYRSQVLTEEGQIMLPKIRDNAKRLIQEAGAASFRKIISVADGDICDMLACVDRLVELQEIREVSNSYSSASHDRIFIQGVVRL